MVSRTPSLSASIIESLKIGEVSSSFEFALLSSNRAHVKHKDETEYWDYKEDVDLDNPIELAILAKRVLAFHNSKGGVLIFGVADTYKVTGIHSGKIVDSVTLRNKIKRYTGDSIDCFQAQLPTIIKNKIIWLIFIPRRSGPPVAVSNNGPDYKGKPIIQKGQYYIRVRDETKLCIDPHDYERLFSGVSFKHLSAYLYEIDEPYYRLLAPHHDLFVGRVDLLRKVQDALNSRSYIIALDGLGGVGKSALAIELVRMLHKAKRYQFIVSVSAKTKIWQGYTEARQAGFSGFTQLITEIARVLDLDISGKDIDDIKKELIEFMDGVEGLLLIDNIEEIQDAAVFDFLRDEVPSPVKILVTSRISRDLGARSIFVSEMNEDEAMSLFYHELDKISYYDYVNEPEDVHDIIRVTGRLPLAIKWAASLAQTYSSLKHVSSKLRGHDTTKREFLNFCFTTMFDELSSPARDVALLCPYLHDNWNVLTLSIALRQPVTIIDKAIHELEDKGLLIASMTAKDGAFSLLPLTMDFLSHKWHENKSFRYEVLDRISKAAISRTYQGNMLDWPIHERIEALFQKALELESRKEFEEALKIVKLAIQWAAEKAESNTHIPRLLFLEGRIIYNSIDKYDGIARMQNAIVQFKSSNENYSDEDIYLAQALLYHGGSSEEPSALKSILRSIRNSTIVTQPLLEEVCNRVMIHGNYKFISDLAGKIKHKDHAYWFICAILKHLHDSQMIYTIGDALVKILELALKSDKSLDSDKAELLKLSKEIKALFNVAIER